MVEICKVLVLNGPVGGLRMLASILLSLDAIPVETDELDDLLEESVSATNSVMTTFWCRAILVRHSESSLLGASKEKRFR